MEQRRRSAFWRSTPDLQCWWTPEQDWPLRPWGRPSLHMLQGCRSRFEPSTSLHLPRHPRSAPLIESKCCERPLLSALCTARLTAAVLRGWATSPRPGLRRAEGFHLCTRSPCPRLQRRPTGQIEPNTRFLSFCLIVLFFAAVLLEFWVL